MKPLPLRTLLWAMLLLDVAGVLAAILHLSGMPSLPVLGWSLVFGVPMLWPTVMLGGFTFLLYRRCPFAAVSAGLLSALAAAWYCYILGDPKYNQDANIGLGMYLLFGALWPLGPVWLFGGVVGQIFSWFNGWQQRKARV